MATFYEGSRGSGKSKYSVKIMQEHLLSNRRVATNLDLFLDKLLPKNPKSSYTRLPDFPRSEDLLLLDKAYSELDHDNSSTYDAKKFGICVLDELLTSFNSRNWNDPDRLAVINWIVQSRKDGWNLALIGQSLDAIDKQIKETVIDELYTFRNSKNLFSGVFWKVFIAPWFNKLFPEFHACRMYDGRQKVKSHFIGVDWFRREDLHSCYKTSQQFKKDVRLEQSQTSKKLIEIDERATYTVLHPDYFKSENSKEGVSNTVPSRHDVENSRQFKISPVKTFLFTFSLLTVGFFLWPSTNTDVKKQEQAEITQKITVDEKPKKVIEPINNDDIPSLGKVFLNCFVYSTDGSHTYCFVNDLEEVITPEYVGYHVIYVSECHAKLYKNKISFDVYCNPRRKKQEYIEPDLTS